MHEATDRGVVNVARYYYHETVQVRGRDDDIRGNIRGGLDVTEASRSGRSGSRAAAGKKRSSSQIGARLPPGKRPSAASSSKAVGDASLNRVHRRVILRDYGKPIYKASSRSALLASLQGSIEGHESLHKAGFSHRDISIDNLMMNEDDDDDADNPSWPSFLIDLDLTVREGREGVSGARRRTGTREFMAIGVLLGEQHSFMHDLESFFWVLFWICIHYDGPDKHKAHPEFDPWTYIGMDMLADQKKGHVVHEGTSSNPQRRTSCHTTNH